MKNFSSIPIFIFLLSPLLCLAEVASFGVSKPTIPQVSDIDCSAEGTTDQEYDWVMLSSGEWLKGDLISLYNLNLEFDSDQLDTLILDWDDVAFVCSRNEFEVLFKDNVTQDGQLLLGKKFVVVMGAGYTRRPREEIVSFAPTSTSFLSSWKGDIGLSMNWRKGNTRQEDVIFRVNAQRRTAKNRFQFAYSWNKGELEKQEVEDNQRLVSSVDWFVSPRWFLRPVQLEYFSDPFQNIKRRTTYTAAIGYYLIDSKRVSWDVYAGPGYQITRFQNTKAGEDDKKETSASAFGTRYSLELTSQIDVEFKYDGQRVSEEAGQFHHHAELGLNIDLLGAFDLDLRYSVDRTQEPIPNSDGEIPQRQDSLFTLGISYDF